MFDFNAKLGHWPYRPVRGLDALLAAMDARGVERAAVSSLDAVHLFNPQDGNDALDRVIAAHRDRFVPFAVLRPTITGWFDDLRRCVDSYGMRGLVLYPNYHRYELTDAALAPLMAEAAQRELPVCVQSGLEDPRRQFRPYKVDAVPPEAIGSFARAYPEVTIVALGLKIGQPELAGDPLPDNFYFDTSNYETMGELEAAVPRFGVDRILLGSNFPLFNPLANVAKLARAGIDEAARDAIGKGNAERILGIGR
ncbi:MAG TPA: amidohydrolase family protein [Candidatus Hydrogenedentes bacterium]|nr:amidohydrolase family protein [Candidatus Hydrogenedentota bacterium]HPG65831.1 amidohydrolase family protein [Candidatus Hydrogenedentota bacterium]